MSFYQILPLLWTFLMFVQSLEIPVAHSKYYDGVNDYYMYANNNVRRANRPRNSRPAVVATFRFEQKPTAGKKSGWHVSGCYCPASSYYCDCSKATTRVNMMINPRRPKSTTKARTQNKRVVKYRERVRDKNGVKTKPLSIRTGCFCDSLGCRGTACNRLNGCVCNDDNGVCWGNNCQTAKPVNTERSLESPVIDPPSSMDKPTDDLLTPFISLLETNNGTSDESKLVESEIDRESRDKTEGCYCDETTCKGPDCNNMNGCFCGSDRCWGRSCGGLSLGTEEDLIFRRKKFPGFEYDNSLDGKVTMVKSKFENLWNSKKNMMQTMGNKFGGLVGNKVNMVQSKLNGIAGTKAHLISSVGNKFTDLAAHKGSMAIPNKFNFFDGPSKTALTMNEVIASDPGNVVNSNADSIGSWNDINLLSGKPSQLSGDTKMNKIYTMKMPQSDRNLNNNMMMVSSKDKNKLIDDISSKLNTLLVTKPSDHGFEHGVLTAKPVTNIDGKMETMLGNKVDVLTAKVNNLITGDAKGMKHLVGQVIPVIKAFPIDSIEGVPVPQIQGMTIGSVPSMPVETKPHKPHKHHYAPQPQMHHNQQLMHHQPHQNLHQSYMSLSSHHSHPQIQQQQLQHQSQQQTQHHFNQEQPQFNKIHQNQAQFNQMQQDNMNFNQVQHQSANHLSMNADASSSKPAGVTTPNPMSRMAAQGANSQQLNQPTVIIRAPANGPVPAVTIRTIDAPQSNSNTKGQIFPVSAMIEANKNNGMLTMTQDDNLNRKF
ncbi:uncharacterized protein LOC112539239 [Tetranychus urticae]|uniref:Post-SET domain-containing protein n=1 Tax=Tetranychus urticae TaxID=32264 RepID=T1JQM6_TETUR|nr:uncharacterized protein LOC112539239 [Tetranychus urticae]